MVERFYPEFKRLYPERYQERYGFWRPIIDTAVARFLACGDLKEGFARVRCPKCRHELFVAFSCRGRCFCPSCHEKRALTDDNRLGRFPEAASDDLLPGPKRNFQIFDPLDFLAEVTQHIPEMGEHLIRYYGWPACRSPGAGRYSNKKRGQRAKVQPPAPEAAQPRPPSAREARIGFRETRRTA